jgi:putative FmdB family regulatory protein
VPLYEYLCAKCGHLFERIDKFTARQTRKCPKCGGKAKRQASAPAIQFKGAGWYVTEYGGKSGADPKAEKTEKTDKSEKGEKSEKSEKTDKAEKKESKAEKPSGKTKEK